MDESARRTEHAARRIMQMNAAYFRSKVLQSAVELGVFELLAAGPATASEICEDLSLHPRLAGDFLDALVGLELLSRADGHYALHEDVADLLVASGGHYLGGTVAAHARKHFRAWSELTAALRDGEAKSDIKGGTEGFMKLYRNADAVARLMDHMDTFNRFVAPKLAACMDWSGYHSFADIGGARGNVAALLVKALPHVTGHVVDLPPVEPLFHQHMAAHGTVDRVWFHGGDFLVDPLPEVDVAIIGHVLHDWPHEYRSKLIDRTYSSVRAGGALLLYDPMIDNDRREADALLQSLNCRILSSGGSEYTVDEARSLVEHAGYRYDTVVDLANLNNDRVVIARKDG